MEIAEDHPVADGISRGPWSITARNYMVNPRALGCSQLGITRALKIKVSPRKRSVVGVGAASLEHGRKESGSVTADLGGWADSQTGLA